GHAKFSYLSPPRHGRSRSCPLFPYTPLFRSPSPGSPVLAAPQIASTSLSRSAASITTSSRIFGSRSRRKIRLEVVIDAADLDKRSEEHTSELQSGGHLVCRLLLEKKKSTAM